MTNELVDIVSDEIAMECNYVTFGLAPNLDKVMIDGRQGQFHRHYGEFSDNGLKTPTLLIQAEKHIDDFITFKDYDDDKATNARIYVIRKIWMKKYEQGKILKPDIAAAFHAKVQDDKAEAGRHIAINRGLKYAEAGTPALAYMQGIRDGLEMATMYRFLRLTRLDVAQLRDSVFEV